ncbi:hypothetical protein VNI00_012594 [Paramarasmius palmivorus]|uniref:Phosphatidylglycerol/phosphatidylinositol transfer protein n=1 Tax=Paramarasmius palmivorus TaxID=297713 RepID=A0AAW0C4Q8_9AGAR
MLPRLLLGLTLFSSLILGAQIPLGSKDAKESFGSWKYDDCGYPTDAIQIREIEISPDPPQAGEKLSITVIAEAIERIEEGAHVVVAVKLGLIKILNKDFNVCEEAHKANTTIQCPVEKGEYNVTQIVDLPKEIPPAKYRVEARGYTVDEDDMLCLNMDVDFRKGFIF